MNAQMLAVLLIVSAAVVYLARQTWRTWAGHGRGCGKGCCGTAANKPQPTAFIPSEHLTLRMRDARRKEEPSS